ncbi:hypothetical protein M2321_001230 [Rhodoblastus acidophilus]|nr:hypothetical protein [Rhodoblastus acidophilus]
MQSYGRDGDCLEIDCKVARAGAVMAREPGREKGFEAAKRASKKKGTARAERSKSGRKRP